MLRYVFFFGRNYLSLSGTLSTTTTTYSLSLSLIVIIVHPSSFFFLLCTSLTFVQNCRLHKCHHRGCAETRLLLVHVRTCPAVGVSSVDHHSRCPTCTRGCNETRKLLAHYRKCKDMRTRRLLLMGGSSSKGSSSSSSQQQHGRRSLLQPDMYRGGGSSSSCLICSLVARYAKGMLDSRPSGGSGGISSLLVSASLLDGKFDIERRGSSSDSGTPPPRPTIERTPSMTLMPPPPPRFGSSCPTSTSTSTLMTSTTNSILRRSSPPDGDDVGGHDLDNNNNKDRNRLRAGSYDERQSRRVKFAPGMTMNIMLQQQQQQRQQTVDGYDDPRCIRPRSASCSNSSSSSSESSRGNNNNTTNACGDGICEAIVEEEDEEGYVERPMFSMDL